jgi:hypothetical protein
MICIKYILNYKNVKIFDFNKIESLQISITPVYLKIGSMKL